MTRPTFLLFPLVPVALFAFASAASSVGCSNSVSTVAPTDGGASDGSSGDGSDGAASSGDSSTGEDGGSTTQACADWAHARCISFDACSNSLYNEIHWGDETACEANSVAVCVADLAAPGTASTAATFEACAGALPSESCADLFGDNPPTACAALAGSVATGAACTTSSQCQSTFCAVGADATCGTCAAVPAAGAACAVDADCGSRGGLTCASGACVVAGQAGASCGAATPCGIGFTCVGDTKTKAGTCQAAASTVGATCDPKHATGPGCDGSLELTCDAATSACVLNTVVAAGQTCGDVNGGTAKCSTSGTCVIPSSDAGPDDAGADAGAAPSVGTCLAAATTGAACDTALGPPCIPAAKCVTSSDASTAGTCQVPNPTTCQ